MSATLERLRNEALELPLPERKELLHELIDSISDGKDESVEAAWDAEIRRRIREVEEGKVECIPHEEVMARARKAIGCQP